LRPDLGAAVAVLCRHFTLLRYAPASSSLSLGQFEAAVRAFHASPGTNAG